MSTPNQIDTRKSLQLSRRDSLKASLQEKLALHRRDSLRDILQPRLSNESVNSISGANRSLKRDNSVTIEEFEKEVDIAEKVKHFNFKIDEEEDISPCILWAII